jgi:hypothetical protein
MARSISWFPPFSLGRNPRFSTIAPTHNHAKAKQLIVKVLRAQRKA